MKNIRKAGFNKFLACLIVLSMIAGFFGMVAPVKAYAEEDPVVVTITGTGLDHDVVIHQSDWANYQMVERYYSSNNTYNFHKISKHKGYDVFELIGEGNILGDSDYNITFIGSGDYEVTKTISELKGAYWYSDFTEESKESVMPMLSMYQEFLFSESLDSLNPPVQWVDKECTAINADAPQLVIGQTTGLHEKNNPYWNKEVYRIVVGEERENSGGEDDYNYSTYKHICYEGEPYNLNAITSATINVQSVGREDVHFSAAQIEKMDEGIDAPITYSEEYMGSTVDNSYEGVTVEYLLNNQYNISSNAGGIEFWKDVENGEDELIGTFSLDDIASEDVNGNKMIIAYGINEVPLVYNAEPEIIDGVNINAGYDAAKRNDNGCLKLVLNADQRQALGINDSYKLSKIVIKESPMVFSITGDGIGAGKGTYTMDDLKAMTPTTESYMYKSEAIECTGVLLSDLLAGLGITDRDWEITVITVDNYPNEVVTLGEAIDEHYLVTYQVGGAVFEDAAKNDATLTSNIRIYRHHGDDDSWGNMYKLVNGIKVTGIFDFFIDNVELLDTSNQSITGVDSQAAYRIKATVTNNSALAKDALVIIQVRNGEGATVTDGGNVLECLGVQMAVPATGAAVTPEFILPDGLTGKAYVDVFVWDGWAMMNSLAQPHQNLTFDISQ